MAPETEKTALRDLLRHPDIPRDFPREDLYRAACIGAVMLLYEAADCEGLLDAVRRASSPESRARALMALRSLTKAPAPVREQAVHILHELAVLDGNTDAANFLRSSDLRDADPGWNSARLLLFGQKHQLLRDDPELTDLTELFLRAEDILRLRLLELAEKPLRSWAELMGFLNDPSPENRAALLDRFNTFSPAERKLIRFFVSDDERIASFPADLLLRCEDETVASLCLEHGLLPSDPSQRALFYFLSGQWDRYYSSDSDYRSIRIAYERKDPALQRRLIAVSRDSGNNAWLRDVGGGSESMPHGGSLADQHLLAASLIEQGQWDALWKLLPNLPLLCMPAVCTALTEAGFEPPLPEERSFFSELKAKIAACEGLSPVPLRTNRKETGGTAVSLSGGGPWTAVCFADRRILLWDRRQGSAEPLTVSSNRLNFRRSVISPDGRYLCADCGSDGITVFTLPGGQAVKTFSAGTSPLAGLFLQPDGRRLITLAQNGTGTVFSFPGGTELMRFDIGLKDCTRAAWDADENRICGVTLDGDCAVYDVSGNRLVNAVRLAAAPLAAAEAFCGSRLYYLAKGELFSAVHLLSGRPVLENISMSGWNVRRVYPLFEDNLMALGTLDGQVRIFDPAAENWPAVLPFGSRSAVTGLRYDAEENVLYGCNSAGAVRSWDLGLFRDMTCILPLLRLPGINRIDEFVKKYPEPGVKAAADWLKTVVLWRRRFDIEIEF